MENENSGTSIIGPFERYKVAVDGYVVPRFEIMPLAGKSDGLVNAIVDGRFCVCCTKGEAQRWAPLIAHAAAVAAGFTCHGENSQRANPYKTKIMCIGTVEKGPDPNPPQTDGDQDA